MALDFASSLFGGSIFSASPNDGETDIHYGNRTIPGSYNQVAISSAPMGNGGSCGVGEQIWQDFVNMRVSDDTYCSQIFNGASAGPCVEKDIRIQYNNILSPKSRSIGRAIPTTEKYQRYGGPNDLWGFNDLAPSQVNRTDFGCGYKIEISGVKSSCWLEGTNFGFDIPEDATIRGVELYVEHYADNGPPCIGYVDNFKILIYYTLGV